ncbi:hypothetical protein, partial [Methylocystis sp.]|uniref:hypothetical protein n=1 Tax=Methylocystis sp. TaxID=1911079 RepID=UPI003D0CF4A5
PYRDAPCAQTHPTRVHHRLVALATSTSGRSKARSYQNATVMLVIDEHATPRLVGTAFIVTANGNHATAISAAHCFEEVRKILHPNPLHHASTPPEFLPPPKEIDLKLVKALYLKGENVYLCPIEIGIWDNATDLATFTVCAPANETELFRDFFWIDDQVPEVGGEVVMIGFGEMKVGIDSSDSRKSTIHRQLLVRLGRVEEVFPESCYMLKGPCIQTTIAIFGGMSGGLLAKWTGASTKIKPFGLIGHAPDPQPTHDRSQSGHSIGSILNARIRPLVGERQVLEFIVSNVGVGKDGTKSKLVSSFDFTESLPENSSSH